MSQVSNQTQNDARAAKNAAKQGKDIAKKGIKSINKFRKSKAGKATKKATARLFAALPPQVKIAGGVVIAVILCASMLVGGTGGVYSNENTHIYSNAKDSNFPMLTQMSRDEKNKDTHDKEDALEAISKYTGIIHEAVEENKQEAYNTINKEINAKNWDRDETYAQIDDQTSFSNGTSITGSSDGEGGDDLASTSGESVVEYARKFKGAAYVWGGEKLKNPKKKGDKNAVDCSGFTMKIFEHFGKKLPHDARQQRLSGKMIGHGNKDLKKALPGDLLVYYGDGGDHVGIYTGKKKGKHYQIHSSVGWGKTGVMETALHRTPKDIVRIVSPSSVTNSNIAKVIKKAKSLKGHGYKEVGRCGGFIQRCYKAAGISIKNPAAVNAKIGTTVIKAKSKNGPMLTWSDIKDVIQPGDILVKGEGGTWNIGNHYQSHVQLYIGDSGKYGKKSVMHAVKGGVKHQKISGKYYHVIRVVKGGKISKSSNTSNISLAQKAVNIARSHIGKIEYANTGKCHWGRLDCGRVVQFAYRDAGKRNVPQNTIKLKKYGKNIGKDLSKAKIGDVLIFHNGTDPYRHAALYSGNGKMIEAGNIKGGRIREVKISKKRKRNLESIRRVTNDNAASDISTDNPFSGKPKKVVKVPTSVKQTGIIKDSTDHYASWNWVQPCKSVFELWKKKGKKSKKGIATINGFYLVAVPPKYGKTGDAISVTLKNGTTFNCIVGDSKRTKGDYDSSLGRNSATPEGHIKTKNGKISIVEFEATGSYKKIKLGNWSGVKVAKIANYGKYNGVDVNNGDYYGEDATADVTVEDLKILAAYSVSLANLQMYQQEGKIKKQASSAGYRMSMNKTYKFVDDKGKPIDVIVNKTTGAVDFEADIKDKMKRYAEECKAKGENAYYDVTFQENSNGSTTYTKTEKIDTGIKDINGKKVYTEITKKYGVPIIKNKDISEICMPMFRVHPDKTYANSVNITNAEAIIELVKNTIAIYYDGDPDQIDGIDETIDKDLQNAYAWPVPKCKDKKTYKLKKKTLVFTGKKGYAVKAIADGVIESITYSKPKEIESEKMSLNVLDKVSFKDNLPATIVVSHEKGAVKAIYKNVIVGGGLKEKSKVKKNDEIATFAGKKMSFQIKQNKKLVNPLQFLENSFTGKLKWPVACKTITSNFGPRNTGIAGASRNHMGVDVGAAHGTPVRAAASGTVTEAKENGGARGKYIKIKHSKKYTTLYQHLSKIKVKKGQKVAQGSVIGNVGSTGVGSGAHLHFEVHINGTPKDPLKYVKPK